MPWNFQGNNNAGTNAGINGGQTGSPGGMPSQGTNWGPYSPTANAPYGYSTTGNYGSNYNGHGPGWLQFWDGNLASIQGPQGQQNVGLWGQMAHGYDPVTGLWHQNPNMPGYHPTGQSNPGGLGDNGYQGQGQQRGIGPANMNYSPQELLAYMQGNNPIAGPISGGGNMGGGGGPRIG